MKKFRSAPKTTPAGYAFAFKLHPENYVYARAEPQRRSNFGWVFTPSRMGNSEIRGPRPREVKSLISVKTVT